MAYQKLQVGLAAKVIPSDTIDIPLESSSKLSGTTAGATVSSKLVNTNAATEGGAFDTIQGLKPGAIVVNVTDGTIATVTAIDSATTLSLSADIISTAGKEYKIFLDPKANHSEGCVLYIGGAGDLKVKTVSGSEVEFIGVLAGTFLPVQVIRVFATTTGTAATNLLALW